MAVRKEDMVKKILTALTKREIAEVKRIEEQVDQKIRRDYPLGKNPIYVPLDYIPSSRIMVALEKIYQEAGWKVACEVNPYQKLPGDNSMAWVKLS